MRRALQRVRENKGAPGIDGMTVEELPGYLERHWPKIKEQLLRGDYQPLPVRRNGTQEAGRRRPAAGDTDGAGPVDPTGHSPGV